MDPNAAYRVGNYAEAISALRSDSCHSLSSAVLLWKALALAGTAAPKDLLNVLPGDCDAVLKSALMHWTRTQTANEDSGKLLANLIQVGQQASEGSDEASELALLTVVEALMALGSDYHHQAFQFLQKVKSSNLTG
jgi:hypothetical protein